MSEKPPGALIAAAAAAPLMVVCCVLFALGPAAITGVIAWASGWVTGLGAVASAGLAIVAAILVYGLTRRRRAKPAAGPGSAAEPT